MRDATSLIPQTLDEMALDADQQELQRALKLKGQSALTREEKRQRQRSLEAIDAPSFYALSKVCSKSRKAYPESLNAHHPGKGFQHDLQLMYLQLSE